MPKLSSVDSLKIYLQVMVVKIAGSYRLKSRSVAIICYLSPISFWDHNTAFFSPPWPLWTEEGYHRSGKKCRYTEIITANNSFPEPSIWSLLLLKHFRRHKDAKTGLGAFWNWRYLLLVSSPKRLHRWFNIHVWSGIWQVGWISEITYCPVST